MSCSRRKLLKQRQCGVLRTVSPKTTRPTGVQPHERLLVCFKTPAIALKQAFEGDEQAQETQQVQEKLVNWPVERGGVSYLACHKMWKVFNWEVQTFVPRRIDTQSRGEHR